MNKTLEKLIYTNIFGFEFSGLLNLIYTINNHYQNMGLSNLSITLFSYLLGYVISNYIVEYNEIPPIA